MNGCAEAWSCSSMLQGLCECESSQEAFTSSPSAAGSGIVCLPIAAIVKNEGWLVNTSKVYARSLACESDLLRTGLCRCCSIST